MSSSWSVRARRGCVVVAVLCVAVLSAPVGAGARAASRAGEGPAGCDSPEAAHEPPCNPALPDAPWATTHRSSYAQGSSVLPGPGATGSVPTRHAPLPGVPISLQFSEPYEDGGIAVWGSLVNTTDTRAVVKLDHETGDVIDLYLPAEREAEPPEPTTGGLTGAYNMLDADGNFIVGRQRSLEVYADEVAGDRFSPIALVERFELPEDAFCRATDRIAGATMTYDGMVAFVTEQGNVGVVPRQPDRMIDSAVVTASLNGDRCADPNVEDAALESVSNNLAVDEDGGLYVVSSEQMYKLTWDADAGTLESTWSAPYETGGEASSIRLGAGSGSTPSLMGTSPDDDRFVVITDAQDLMHVVLFWRDEVPDGWEPIRPGADPRIACEYPVTFGDENATTSLSEQSVLVRGYASVIVNNALADESRFAGLPPQLANAQAALEGGNPDEAPRGFERIDWNPDTQTCESVWANDEVSVPNGVPTMSQDTGLVYGIGQRDGVWGVEALDFDSGESVRFIEAANEPCTEESLAGVDPSQRAALDVILERLPNSCENSVYAATEVGPDSSIYTGTFLGISSYLPDEPVGEMAPAGAGDSSSNGWIVWAVVAGVAALGAVVLVLTRFRRDSASGP